MTKRRPTELIGIIAGVLVTAVVAFILIFYRGEQLYMPKYSGADIQITSSQIEKMKNESDYQLEKELKSQIHVGLALKNLKTKKIEWLIKSGHDTSDSMEILMPMDFIKKNIENISDKGKEGIIFLPIKSKIDEQIIGVISLKVNPQEEKTKSEEGIISRTETGREETSLKVEKETIIEKPEEPTNGKLSFLGWYYEDDEGTLLKFDFQSPVTESVDLIALWSSRKDPVLNVSTVETTNPSIKNITFTEEKFFPTQGTNNSKIKKGTTEEYIEWTSISLLPTLVFFLGIKIVGDLMVLNYYRIVKKKRMGR